MSVIKYQELMPDPFDKTGEEQEELDREQAVVALRYALNHLQRGVGIRLPISH